VNSKQQRVMPRTVSFCWPTLVLLWLSGCGGQSIDAPSRAVVTGEVTYAGQPVTYGHIRFVPDSNSGLPVAGAVIRDGRYRADNKGGVAVGKHRVEIVWLPPIETDEMNGGNSPQVSVPKIPEKYNTASTLELVVESGAGPQEHHFHLK